MAAAAVRSLATTLTSAENAPPRPCGILIGAVASTTSLDALDTVLYDYELPEERIAQTPLAERDGSRLLHVPPGGAPFEDRGFRELPDLLRAGDLLVLNDTRVRAARLSTRTEQGGAIEVLVLQNLGDGRYACLVRPGRRLKPGRTVSFDGGLTATVEGESDGHPGARLVRFHSDDGDTDAAIERLGTVPLPPYIHTALPDSERYQTVYAQSPPQSAAAPTAGLHFTPRVLDALHSKGITTTTVRLEVGLGTFAPIRTERIDDHEMHEERFELPPHAAEAIAATKQQGGRVIAVGTTAVRTVESCATDDGGVQPQAGTTKLFIRPGRPFKVVDGLLTNFHAPRSSLVVLVAAMIGANRWRAAYAHALHNDYRFLSFGDCMLCWRA